MDKIKYYKIELFEVYKNKFPNCDEKVLQKEFDSFINLDSEFMPFWFTVYLLKNGFLDDD